MPGANSRQVRGKHYKKLQIQPWDFIAANDMDYFTGSAVAYLSRYRDKGDPLGDLEKAAHYIQKLIELIKEKGKK